MKRGRPCTYDKDIIIAAVKARKSEVSSGERRIVSRYDDIWKVLSDELNNIITPHALFTFVTNNRHGIKDFLIPPPEPIMQVEIFEVSVHDESSNVFESSTASVNEEHDEVLLDIEFDKAELEILLIKKQYGRSEKDRPQNAFREYIVLQPGKWQEAITKKLWEVCKKKRAFQFKCKKVYNNKLEVFGKCNCGSVLKGSIKRLNLSSKKDTMACEITSGDGTCGIRYLREPIRSEVGKTLFERNKTAEVYRAEEADRLMSPGDPEPPHLYKAEALRKAKETYQTSLTLHKNPVTSILLAKLSSLKYVIRNIGLSPFYVHYWSNLQTNVYKQYAIFEPSSVAIGATGSIIRKLNLPDRSKSHHVFPYTCVVNSCNSPKFPVTQMISESHTTVSIWYWLMEWVGNGAPPLKEVTCDASKALLLATTREFTNCSYIEEYAGECWGTCATPSCYIRIDVAHFIKTYSNFLKVAINQKIKTFYLAALGQLILTRTICDAENILFAILAIARSKTEGSLVDGQLSTCETQKHMLNDIFRDVVPDINFSQDLEQGVDESSLLEDTECTGEHNPWHTWAMNVSNKVALVSRDTGDRVNAHFLPELADRILKDMKWFLLWSCISRDRFGYGRIPASSAAVESEFNSIKTRLLSNMTLPIRADIFLKKHMEFISGRLKLVNAEVEKTRSNTADELLEVEVFVEPDLLDKQVESKCPACAMGDKPSGAHICAICGLFVHALDLCSKPMPGEEEGYGQMRLCSSCSEISGKAVIDIVNSREQENWRGLSVQPPKKKSPYLQKSFTENEFLLHGKIEKLPIIKNGSSLTLQATNLKGKKITLTNTCAFDSMYQIFLE